MPKFVESELYPKDLIERLRHNTNCTWEDAEYVYQQFIKVLEEAVNDPYVKSINLTGFGRFNVYEMKPIRYPDLKTGEMVYSKPSTRLHFKQYPVAKNAMKKARAK